MENNWLYEPRDYEFRGKSETGWVYGDLSVKEVVESSEEVTIVGGDDTIDSSETVGGSDSDTVNITVEGGDDTVESSEETISGGDDTVTTNDTVENSEEDSTIESGEDSITSSDETVDSGEDSTVESSDTITSDDTVVSGEDSSSETTVTKYYIGDVEVNKETLGLYVGIMDEENNKIYEGDIIQIGSESSYGIVTWNNNDPLAYIVRYIKFNDEFTDNKITLLYTKHRDSYLVIGNVFDNPELIPISEFPLPRAIMFRGQNAGVWYTGDMYRKGLYAYIKTDSETYLVNPRTICQYTGFEDANNIAIYENDIVEMSIHALKYSPMTKFKVVWEENDSSFVLYRKKNGVEIKSYNLDSDIVQYLRIIGNMFDSPERFK